MNFHRNYLFVFWLLAFFAGARANTFNPVTDTFFLLESFKIQPGDDLAWAQPDFDDSTWPAYSLDSRALPVSGNYWLRAPIFLTGALPDSLDFLAAQILRIPAAYELFWDGHRLLENGRVGFHPADEVPGRLGAFVRLHPAWTRPGRHILALRVSNFRLGQSISTTPRIRFGTYAFLQTLKMEMLQIDIFDIAIFLLTLVFSLAFFLGGGPNRAYFLFLIFCLMNVIYSASGFVSQTIPISVVYSPVYTLIDQYAGLVALYFLNLFFIFNFPLSKKWLHAVLSLAFVLLGYFLLPTLFFPVILLYGVWVAVFAVKQRAAGSLAALAGISVLILAFFLFRFRQIFYLFFVGEIGFIFCIALSLSLRIRAQNRQLVAAQLRSSRLEAELLRKNIQPHFLMNTLFSIISWIPVEPKKAIQLIQSLAEEFRMINQISQRQMIRLSEEIHLCELHLQLMELRMDATYHLQQKIISDDLLPPMILHTLIENGLTHAFESGESGTFEIEQQVNGHRTIYCIRNNGSRLGQPQFNGRITEGMGLRYVRTRLDESFRRKWSLESGLKNGFWEVRIELDYGDFAKCNPEI